MWTKRIVVKTRPKKKLVGEYRDINVQEEKEESKAVSQRGAFEKKKMLKEKR